MKTTSALNFVTFTNPLVSNKSSISAHRRHLSVTPLPSSSVSTFRRPQVPCAVAASATHTLNGQTLKGPLQPANHNLLVKVAEADDKTAGGIILPDEAQEKPTFGEVIEAGPGKYLGNGIKIPMHVSKGDVVMYGKYGGTDLNYDGAKHTVVTQDDILCKFKDGDSSSADKCEPIFDRVLIMSNEPSEETVGGIVLSASAKKQDNSGTVIAMGPGRFMENGELEPKAFDVGDVVYYSTYAGTPVTLDGKDYVIVRVADVYAKA